MNPARLGAGLLAALLAAGCATPESRIAANPERFATYEPAQREKIREGNIDIGFTLDMVELALGKPDLVAERTTPEGTRTVWRHLRTDSRLHTHPVTVTGRLRGTVPAWFDVRDTRLIETMRIEFENDQAAVIERLRD